MQKIMSGYETGGPGAKLGACAPRPRPKKTPLIANTHMTIN